MADGNVVQRRPAEVATGVAGAVAVVLSRILGFDDDPDLMTAVTVLVAAIPTLITWVARPAPGAR